jgi:hypothetical protein
MGFLSKVFKPFKSVFKAIFKPVLGLLKKWLLPKQAAKEALKIERAGSDQYIPVIYGQCITGGVKVDLNVTDAPGGADNEFFINLLSY